MSNVCPLGGLPLPVHPREKNAYLLKLVIRIKTVIPKPPLFLGETICGISSTYFREDGSARSDIGSGSLWKLPPLQFQSILKLAFKSSSVPLSSNGDLGARDGQVCPGICHRS